MEKLVREKLLPLLDKFEEERAEKIGKSEERNNIKYNPRVWSVNDVLIYEKYKVYSKEYGFIKWLDEKDKIDQTVIEGNFGYFCMEGFDTVDSLLMVLAISNEPINDLISYLK